MKVVWLSHVGSIVGGADIAFLEAVEGLRERGVEIHAILPDCGSLAGRLEKLGIPISIFPYNIWLAIHSQTPLTYGMRNIRSNLTASLKLARLFKVIRPDLVITNTLINPVGAFAAKFAGIPHVWYIHELFGKESHGNLFAWGNSLSLSIINRFSKRVIVNSHALFDFYQKYLSKEKLRMVYYAVEVPPEVKKIERRDNALKLIQVGSVTPGKRQEDAVRAISLLKQKGLDLHLTLLGREQPEYGAFLRGLVKQLDVEHLVEFISFTDDPFSYTAASDIALMCSRGEAFGRVTIEAMKLGKPVIGAKSGGTAELIQDGVNGFLYPLANVDVLSEKIETLYRNPTVIRELGGNAREWSCKTFNMENYISSLLQVFEGALKPRYEAGRG